MPRRTNPPNNRDGVVVSLPPAPPPPPPPPRPPRQRTLPMGPLPPEQYRRTGDQTSFGPTPSPSPPPPRASDPRKQARVRLAESRNPVPLDPAIREMNLARRGVFEPPPLPADTPKPVSRIVRGGDERYAQGQQHIYRVVSQNARTPSPEGGFNAAVQAVRDVFRNPPRLHGAGNPNRRRTD